MTVQTLVTVVLQQLIDERKVLAQNRPSRASDAALDWAIGRMSEANRHVAGEEWTAAKAAVGEVAHRAIDSWSLTAPVTDALARCDQELRRIVADA
jgi:hypothetical protein